MEKLFPKLFGTHDRGKEEYQNSSKGKKKDQTGFKALGARGSIPAGSGRGILRLRRTQKKSAKEHEKHLETGGGTHEATRGTKWGGKGEVPKRERGFVKRTIPNSEAGKVFQKTKRNARGGAKLLKRISTREKQKET